MWNLLHISHTSIIVSICNIVYTRFSTSVMSLPSSLVCTIFTDNSRIYLYRPVIVSILLPLVTYSEKFTLRTLLSSSLISATVNLKQVISCCIFIILCTRVIAPARCVYHNTTTNNIITILLWFRTEVQLIMNISVLTTSDFVSGSTIAKSLV